MRLAVTCLTSAMINLACGSACCQMLATDIFGLLIQSLSFDLILSHHVASLIGISDDLIGHTLQGVVASLVLVGIRLYVMY